MRHEQLVKLRGLYVSLGGLSADLENSVKLLNDYAAANCQHISNPQKQVFFI